MSIYVTGFWSILLLLDILAVLGCDRTSPRWAAIKQPELGVAVLLSSAALLTVLLRPAVTFRFVDLELAMLAIDFGLFVGLAAFAVRSGKGWILCAAALQLISATAHVARLMTPGMWRLGYQVMEESSSYPTLMLLAWGIWIHHRRAKTAVRSKTYSRVRDVPAVIRE